MMTLDEVRHELRGLIDSLDEHVGITEIHEKLTELYDLLEPQPRGATEYTFQVEAADPEIAALEISFLAITSSFRLDDAARSRIVKYLADRYEAKS